MRSLPAACGLPQCADAMSPVVTTLITPNGILINRLWNKATCASHFRMQLTITRGFLHVCLQNSSTFKCFVCYVTLRHFWTLQSWVAFSGVSLCTLLQCHFTFMLWHNSSQNYFNLIEEETATTGVIDDLDQILFAVVLTVVCVIYVLRLSDRCRR